MNIPKRLINITGQRFGHLLVINYIGEHISNNKKTRQRLWLCLCDCGNTKIASSVLLRKGKTDNCGCKTKDRLSLAKSSHGLSSSDEYKTWARIKNRCYNKNTEDYSLYGARGIVVCDRWLNSFENFYSDMGVKPSKKHSIDRINNDGNYEPSNCRWSSIDAQARNKRNNVNLTLNNKTMCLKDWAKEIGICEASLRGRIKRWGNINKCLITKKGEKYELL